MAAGALSGLPGDARLTPDPTYIKIITAPFAALSAVRRLAGLPGDAATAGVPNKFLVTGVNASLALWPDYEILEQKNAARFDSIWIISKSGRSSSALNWVKALEGKEINLVCFTGDYQSPLAQAADTAFIIHDPQKFDDDIYWSNPFFGYCILGFERLLKMWFTRVRSNS